MNWMLLAVALLGLLPLPAAESQDAKQWAEALAYFQRCSGSRDTIDRKQAADRLGEATAEKYDKHCWQLLQALLRAELAREGQNGRTEEKVAGEVIDACINAFRKLSHKDVVAEMTKLAKAKAEHARIRAYIVWGLSDKGDLKDLTELCEDKSSIIQIAAMDCLAERADASSTSLFLRVL